MTATSTDFATWAAGRAAARFTDWLREGSEPAWTAATTHRFTRELADATIDIAAFRRYLVQDYAFLDGFVRLLDAALAAAPEASARQRLSDFRAGVTGDENTYFQRSFDAVDIAPSEWRDPPLLPATRGLLAAMAEAAGSGSYARIMTVLVATEWVYCEWASAVADIVPEAFYFNEWIELHANDEFRALVAFLRGELDREGPALPAGEQAAIAELFARTVRLEREFFDQAYG